MSTKKILLLIVLLILLILAAGAVYWFFFYQPATYPSDEETQTQETAPATSTFEGQFVSAEVPEDWTIIEYQNGNGTTMLVEGETYIGLTGLEVKNPAAEVIFKLEAVYGIGGMGGCDTYFKFDDDSPTYYNSVLSTNEEVGRGIPAIVDLRGLPYSSLEFFETRIRRIGTNLYWDTDPGATHFEAACGMQEKLFDFGAPQFTIAGPVGGTSGTYRFTVLSSASTEDLEKLDAILNSLIVL